jgi:pyrroline-5-carboxylate reductase
MYLTMNLGFIGTGAITSAIVTGLNSPGLPPHSIIVSPRNSEIAAGLARRFPNVSIAHSNQQVLDRSGTVILAVRPQVFRAVVRELRFRADHHVISVVAAFSVRALTELVAPAATISRAIPLPSTADRRCPTAIYPRDPIAVELFAPLGAALEVETEAELNALSTATAAMASYFAFADSLASWLTRHDIPPPDARDYVGRVMLGLALTAAENPGRTFQELAADHATPGGMNEQVRAHLTNHGVFDAISDALDGVLRRVTAEAE